MLLRILHRTTYAYPGSVNMAQHMAHLTPLNTAGQTLHEHTLRISPEPAARTQTVDVFGNLRTFFSLQAPHDTLSVEADSLVETSEPRALPLDTDVRHQQDLFQRVGGINVDLARARLGGAAKAHHLVETIEAVPELLRRLLQPLFQFVE